MKEISDDLPVDSINVSARTKLAFISTFAFGLLAHAFAYFNLLYSHDSLMICTDDALWQISLGRYLQPLYILLRQPINTPWVNGMLSLLFIALAVCLIADMFEITSRLQVIVLSGIATTNITVISMNSTYMPWADVFSLSLLLASLAAWLLTSKSINKVVRVLSGGTLLAISMALYQSYLAVYITLAMIYAIWSLLKQNEVKAVCRTVAEQILGAAVAAVLYTIGLKLSLSIAGIQLAANYGGLARLGDYSTVSVSAALQKTYTYFLSGFFGAQLLPIERALNSVLILSILAFCIILCRKRPGRLVLIILVVIFYPFGANFICFLAKGTVYEMMTYSFSLVYILPLICCTLVCCPRDNDTYRGKRGKRVLLVGVCILEVAIIASNNIVANQVYTKKKLV